MNEKTDCCKMNTASQRHFRSSIINNIFAYLGELQGRDKLNADQARKNIFFLFYICVQTHKRIIFINKIKTPYLNLAGVLFGITRDNNYSCTM